MNTSRHKSEPPSKKWPPEKQLFKWNHEQGETLEQFAERVVQETLAKAIKPGPFRPPPQNPN